MAKIHGISGSTRYLLKGTKPINGKNWQLSRRSLLKLRNVPVR
jgi:hypothetical protein